MPLRKGIANRQSRVHEWERFRWEDDEEYKKKDSRQFSSASALGSDWENRRMRMNDGVLLMISFLSFFRVHSVYCISLVFAPGSAHTSYKRLSIEQIISCAIISVVVSRLAAGCWPHSIHLIRFKWFYSIFMNISVNWISIDSRGMRGTILVSSAVATRNIAYLFWTFQRRLVRSYGKQPLTADHK